jgi:hypothetical protein
MGHWPIAPVVSWAASGGRSSAGRALASQAKGRGFEPRRPLLTEGPANARLSSFRGRSRTPHPWPTSGPNVPPRPRNLPNCRAHRPPPEFGRSGRRRPARLVVTDCAPNASGSVRSPRRRRPGGLCPLSPSHRPGEPFDLDHSLDRTSYLGVSHRRCNRVAGAKVGAAVTNQVHRCVSSREW